MRRLFFTSFFILTLAYLAPSCAEPFSDEKALTGSWITSCISGEEMEIPEEDNQRDRIQSQQRLITFAQSTQKNRFIFEQVTSSFESGDCSEASLVRQNIENGTYRVDFHRMRNASKTTLRTTIKQKTMIKGVRYNDEDNDEEGSDRIEEKLTKPKRIASRYSLNQDSMFLFGYQFERLPDQKTIPGQLKPIDLLPPVIKPLPEPSPSPSNSDNS